MILITSDNSLRPYLPNALKTVAGEMSFFEKLTPDLESSELWFATNFVAPDSLQENPQATALARQIVVDEALLRAVPQLDLILTPNGFGIVSNQNVVPASKDRVERLLVSLELDRDKNILQLLPLLPSVAGWENTIQGHFFGATLFPFLDIAPLLGHREHFWAVYQQYRPRLIEMEQELAEKFISTPLYERLRLAYLRSIFTLLEADLINRLRAVELSLLRGERLNIPELRSMVELIRTNPEEFPEWTSSTTAVLYTNHSFHNKKQSGGYWF